MAGKRLGMGKNVGLCLLSLLLIFTILGCQRSNVGSNTVGPEGGEVRSRDGRFKVEFPPGALTQEVKVTIIKISFPNPEDIFDTDDGSCEYTYNLDDISPFLTMRPTAGYISNFEPRDENGNSDVLLEPLLQDDDGNGNPRLMEDNKTIVDTNEDNVVQEARLFTDQGEVLIPPIDIDLIGRFSANKFNNQEGIPMIDIIFTPSNLGFFFINRIFLDFLNGLPQNTELNMNAESGNFEIILPNLCDPFSANPSITDATFNFELDTQMPFMGVGSLSLEYRTNCEEQSTGMPSPSPPLPPPPVMIDALDGLWMVDCISEEDPFGIIAGNLGSPVVLDVEIDVNTATGGVTITTSDGLFTLMGTVVDQQNGIFVINAEGSGMLGDTSPNAANIIVRAENWNFVVNELGEIVFTDGQLRFNFPSLPLNSQSSVASCFGEMAN